MIAPGSTDTVGAALRAHDDAAVSVTEHVLECNDGCTMQIVRCQTGRDLAEAERSAWKAYYAARWPERVLP